MLRRTIPMVALCAVVALASIPLGALAQANSCTNLPEECTDAETCGASLDDFNVAHFQVEFLSRSYDGGADATTFTYLVCRLAPSPDLSHWVLGLCDGLRAEVVDSSGGGAGSGPVDPDPTTCLSGFKFETPGGVPLCDDTCPAGSSTGGVFSVTLAGDVPTDLLPAGVMVSTKAGTIEDNFCLEGPACSPPPTTTTTAPPATTTTTSTSSTTTIPSPLCGNEVLDPDEECDPPGSLSCPPSTPGGAFLECDLNCRCPDAETTTTTTVTTPTTSTSSTTSTTLPEGECLVDEDCNDGDLCTEDRCVDTECVHEPLTDLPPEDVCGDMVDNDCDGLADCADPDCDNIQPCPIKKDPATIRFGAPGAGLDILKAHGRVEPDTPLDVGSLEIGWMLANRRGPIWRGALIPGDFRANPTKTSFRFLDNGAKTASGRRFGVRKAKIRITRGGTSYGFKVQAYGDLSKATDPDMTLHFYIGDDNWSHTEPWKAVRGGWKATGFE